MGKLATVQKSIQHQKFNPKKKKKSPEERDVVKNKKSGENGDLSECFEKGEEKRKCGYWLKLITKTEKRGEKNWDSVCDDDEESKLSSSRTVSFLGFSNGLGG